MRRTRQLLLPLYLFLGACMPVAPSDTAATRAASDAIEAPSGMPPMKSFSVPRPAQPVASNSDMARDFLDLAFTLESGRSLSTFTRFDGPISVRVTGAPPASLGPDLNRLLHRLRTEAGIPIKLTNTASANITVQAVTRSEIRSALPTAACFVVPNVTSLKEYKANRRTRKVSWSQLKKRDKLAIFLPNDASPQEVRDCLHEELAQAIGPLNDLYRLPDSVFNDDNVHTVLTGYDMTILRAYYDPALRTGMTRNQVADRLPEIFARINPRGASASPKRLSKTPRIWIDAVQTALGPGANPAQRRASATEALKVATAMGWNDHRRAFSHYAMGRLLQATDPQGAQDHFVLAQRYFGQSPDTALHRAYVASQLAAYAISAGRANDALYLLTPHLDTAARHENAALLATLMMLSAEALELAGRVTEGRKVRLDSLGWARYGFGSEWAVRAKLREIGSLNPARRRSGAL
ncbi:DUF2927 domain-containing protein [Tropicibacter naphthalenivorans]|uniref:ATP-dependent transcriptional regulator n=1 Tax=Tropicibacter naphthalenivorans TaxID=441103 RepID=A0A0P1H170_9RHOB|nr:DUF2927 domain-containing protein [Tropicibacter naphthalenivorans]CUH80362.1 hypothetical protein TRN7648_02950 [Tropicibacter naphthalenivorans]SMC85974.1 Protein of unknown function [Tropicibacter naphthalenivorans]